MDVEAVPELTASELAAVRIALARARVRLDAAPDGYSSPWRRAAAREAVDTEPVRSPAGYAPSPRSTRGATRA